MKNSEFDQFAEEYRIMHASSIKASGESPEFFYAYKVNDLANHVRASKKTVGSILDFGCGVGNSLPYFRQNFPTSLLMGADVSQNSLKIAEQRFPDIAKLHHIRDDSLASLEQKFDIIFSACVFHHIPHEEHLRWLKALRDVANPGALLVIFEHNPWNPITVHAVNTCPFDVNARLLSAPQLKRLMQDAGWEDARVEFKLFFPAALSKLRRFENAFSWLPIGAQYAVYANA